MENESPACRRQSVLPGILKVLTSASLPAGSCVLSTAASSAPLILCHQSDCSLCS